MVATDVAARGLDVNDVDMIIHWHCRHVDSFVHRTGRTGRAGKSGINIAFVTRDMIEFYKSIEENLNIKLNYVNKLSFTDDTVE